MSLTLTIELHVEVVVQHGVRVEPVGQNSQRLFKRVACPRSMTRRDKEMSGSGLWEKLGKFDSWG